MIKTFAFLLNISLMIIIFLRLPQDVEGFENFSSKSNILGSPNSAQRLSNTITALGILIYFSLALKLNLDR